VAIKQKRIFNMSGRMADGEHRQLQIGQMHMETAFVILDFKVWPTETDRNCQLNGTLTMKRDDAIDPSEPSFKDTNQFAWTSYNICDTNVIPAPGITPCSIISSGTHIDDEKYFAQDIHVHTNDAVGTQGINYWIKIAEFDTPPDVGSLIQLRQFGRIKA